MDLKSMDIFEIQAYMEEQGYWMVLKSPLEKGDFWSCGFTQLGCSGFNGQPDYESFGATAQEAVVLAAADHQREVMG